MRHFLIVICAASLILLAACSNERGDNDELGLSVLTDYCRYRGLNEGDFGQPRIFSDRKYDIVVEYTTKTNIAPRHVLLVYIKDGRIIERHSMVEDDEE